MLFGIVFFTNGFPGLCTTGLIHLQEMIQLVPCSLETTVKIIDSPESAVTYDQRGYGLG